MRIFFLPQDFQALEKCGREISNGWKHPEARVKSADMENEKKEIILLDARLADALSKRAFRARLANGHGFVAYLPDGKTPHDVTSGDEVKVAFSPFDMSSARIVFEDLI